MNNKRTNSLFIICILIFSGLSLFAQERNYWISHISYHADIKAIVQTNDIIYALTDGKLFIYNNSDDSLEEYIKYNGGNSDIQHIAYNKKYECLVITRVDGLIELLYSNNNYKEIFNLKDYAEQNIDKTINHVFMTDDFAYLSTNFGFMTINLDKVEIKETGIFYKKFYSISSLNDELYATTEDGVYAVDINNNIQDISNWEKFSVSAHYNGNTQYNFEDKSLKNVLAFAEKLYFIIPDTAIYVMNSPTEVTTFQAGNNPQLMYKTDNEHLIVTETNAYWDYENHTQYKKVSIEDVEYIIPNGSKQNEYWVSKSGYNLSLIKTNESDYEFLKSWISPQGPVSNYSFSQTIQNGKLIVTGGGFHYNREGRAASLSILNTSNSSWTNIYPNTISEVSGFYSRDLVYAISDPSNSDRIFASSWGEGLYEFENNRLKTIHDKTNSSIEELVADIEGAEYRTTRVSGMDYDNSGNLWLLNSMVEGIVKVYTKSGSWEKIVYPQISYMQTNPKSILIDRYSNKWIITLGRDEGYSNYIFVFNENGTISNTSDDKYKYQDTFINQNGNALSVVDINCIAEDNNGTIWVGTNIGPFYISNSSNIANQSGNIVFNKPMIERGSESSSVIGLLENVVVNSIAVDGANRKWIGTQNIGVFLLSADRKEVLASFNADNSPLPSNNIISLSVNPQSGDVYIGTDKGLMAYKSGVTQGSESFSDVYVYPNPVHPDYSGLITVTGLMTNSRVKITDVKGNLIIEGKSSGGQFVWDGLNGKGRRVDTGIYLVFGSSEDGSEGVVTKIMFIKE